MRKILITLLMLILLTFAPQLAEIALAAPPPPPPFQPIPIDGGLGLLLAAGLAYGARKLYKNEEV